jgi:hypothetical protein
MGLREVVERVQRELRKPFRIYISLSENEAEQLIAAARALLCESCGGSGMRAYDMGTWERCEACRELRREAMGE